MSSYSLVDECRSEELQRVFSARPVSRELVEIFQDRVPVSGQMLVGFQAASPGLIGRARPALRGKDLQASRQICVHVATQDGRYELDGTFDVPDVPDDAIVELVGFPGLGERARAHFQEQSRNDIAVRIRRGACGSQSNDPLLPVFWYGGTVDPLSDHLTSSLQILIAGLGAETVFAAFRVRPGDPPIRLNCGGLQGPRTVGFDFFCALPEGTPSGIVQLSIVPVLAGEAQPGISTRAVVP